MAGLSAQEELILLRKRARRRLVGAVVLMSLATGVLWRVVGRVPEAPMKPESVLVVGASASGSLSRAPGMEHPATAAAAAVAAATVPQEASRPQATALPESLSSVTQPLASGDATPAKKEPAPVATKHATDASTAHARRKAETVEQPIPDTVKPKAHKKPDPAAILDGRTDAQDTPPPAGGHVKMMIQLAALSDADKVDALRKKLDAAGVVARFSKVQTSKGEATRVRVGPFASRAEADAALRKLARAGVSGIVVTMPTT
jgi:DedD protein